MKAKAIEMELRAYLGEAMDREKRDNILHKLLAELLKEKYQGKKLTARLATQFKERLPEAYREAVVYYGDEYGLCEIMIWGKCIPDHEDHGKRLVFFLCHKGEKSSCYDVAYFESNDCCHGKAAEERNAKRIELCQGNDLPKIAALVAGIEQAREELAELTKFDSPGQQVEYCPRVYKVTHEPRNS